MKSLVGRLLFNTPLYPFARSVYRKVKRGPARVNPAEVSFYAGFVRPGDLVFDIGANVGQKSEVFLACRAKVVAAESNPGRLERLMACLERLVTLSQIRINAVKMSADGHPSGLVLEEFVSFAAFSPAMLPEGSDCLVAMDLPGAA